MMLFPLWFFLADLPAEAHSIVQIENCRPSCASAASMPKPVADAGEPARTSVESVMSRPAITCSPDDPYEQVLQTMERHNVLCVPVMDRSGRLVGIVSQADIALQVRAKKQTAEVVQEISRPAA